MDFRLKISRFTSRGIVIPCKDCRLDWEEGLVPWSRVFSGARGRRMLLICRQSLLACIPREEASWWCVSPEIRLPNGVKPANQRKGLKITTRRCSGTYTVPVPDLEIRGRGGGWSSRPLVKWEGPVSKKTFPRVPPLDPPLIYPHVRESKTVLVSRFKIPLCGFRNSGTGFRILCQWNLDSGFESLVGFRSPWVVFRIPQAKISWIPEFRVPNMGQNISALPFGDHTCKRPTENKERRPGPGCSKVGEDNPGLVWIWTQIWEHKKQIQFNSLYLQFYDWIL